MPSELILTDTGVSSDIRTMLEEYSDHIIDYTWCKDFSHARNAGLREAKGQWFMYLDDDEWFEDTKAIEDFFLSKQCDEYNVAFYVQRNHLDFSGSNYADHNVDRIIRRTPDLHFIHRVHEAYTGVEASKKAFLESYANHYGYIYTDEEEHMKKLKRNQELLDIECQEYPEDYRMRHQAVANSISMKNYEYAIELASQVLDDETDNEYWDALHTDILYALECQKKYEQMIEQGIEFLNHKLFPIDTFGCLQYIVTAYWKLGKGTESLEAVKWCIELYREALIDPDKFDLAGLKRQEFFHNHVVYKMLAFSLATWMIFSDDDLCLMLMQDPVKPKVREMLMSEYWGRWNRKFTEECLGDAGIVDMLLEELR